MSNKHFLLLAAWVCALTASAQQTASVRIVPGQAVDPALVVGAYSVDATELRATPGERPQRRIDAETTADRRPEGDFRIYRMNFTTYDHSSGGNYNEDAYSLSGAGSNVVFGTDGEVWFYNLIPTTYHAWFQGSMADGVITFSDGKLADVLLTDGSTGELYITPGIPNGDNLTIRGDFQFTVTDGKIVSTDPTVWVCSWLVIDNRGYLLYMYRDYAMTQEENIDVVTPPADAVVEPFAITYNTTGISWYGVLGQVATAGSDIYFDRLTPDCPGSWVKGTVDSDGRITITGEQFLGTQDGYIVDYAGGHSDDGGLNISVQDQIHLAYTDGDPTRIALDEGDYIFEFNRCTLQPLRMITGLRMERYDGDQPLTPSHPYMLMHSEDYGDRFAFIIDNVSEDYRYLNPANIGWRVFVDGEPYTFTPTDYPVLQQAADVLPWNFVAGEDFFYASGIQGFYLYIDDWQTVDVQAVYTVAGEQRVSAQLARYDRTDGSGIVAAVSPATRRQTDGPAALYDLSGRRVSVPTSGITLQRQSDGAVRKVVARR